MQKDREEKSGTVFLKRGHMRSNVFVFVYPADKTPWDYWWLLTIASLHRENCSWMMASLTVSQVCVCERERANERKRKKIGENIKLWIFFYTHTFVLV